jgi:hypothetical protein
LCCWQHACSGPHGRNPADTAKSEACHEQQSRVEGRDPTCPRISPVRQGRDLPGGVPQARGPDRTRVEYAWAPSPGPGQRRVDRGHGCAASVRRTRSNQCYRREVSILWCAASVRRTKGFHILSESMLRAEKARWHVGRYINESRRLYRVTESCIWAFRWCAASVRRTRGGHAQPQGFVTQACLSRCPTPANLT